MFTPRICFQCDNSLSFFINLDLNKPLKVQDQIDHSDHDRYSFDHLFICNHDYFNLDHDYSILDQFIMITLVFNTSKQFEQCNLDKVDHYYCIIHQV